MEGRPWVGPWNLPEPQSPHVTHGTALASVEDCGENERRGRPRTQSPTAAGTHSRQSVRGENVHSRDRQGPGSSPLLAVSCVPLATSFISLFCNLHLYSDCLGPAH